MEPTFYDHLSKCSCGDATHCGAPAASAGYSCWQLFTVKTINGGESVQGCIPLLTLPESLVGKTVKVTIEEQF
jgi:hypothetical protein